jgi:hypothetical protein
MKCSKFFGLLLIGGLGAMPSSGLELEQLWEVTLPEGQSYLRANIAWSPSDNLPHLLMMGNEDLSVYHMTPGQEFEPILTLPTSIVCFGVCLDTTRETSVLACFRNVGSNSGQLEFLDLQTGSSLFSYDITTYSHGEGYDYEYTDWWYPNGLFCSGANNGMVAHLCGPYHSSGWSADIIHYSSWEINSDYWNYWNVRNFQMCYFGWPHRSTSRTYCLMGSDSLPDLVFSGRSWGYYYNDWWDSDEWDYRATTIYFVGDTAQFLRIADSQGRVMALARADGPAWSLLFFCDDSMTYYRRGPTHVWTVPSNISAPILALALPLHMISQRVALVYSSSGEITEVDLRDGHIASTTDFPANVKVLQPYLAPDGSWELMAVFDRSARGYRVSGILPIDDETNPVMPWSYSLGAFPNPFNESVKIVYELPRTATVRLRLVDILGREVTMLVNDLEIAGKHETTWNSENLASGIYFVCLDEGSTARVLKLVHLK